MGGLSGVVRRARLVRGEDDVRVRHVLHDGVVQVGRRIRGEEEEASGVRRGEVPVVLEGRGVRSGIRLGRSGRVEVVDMTYIIYYIGFKSPDFILESPGSYLRALHALNRLFDFMPMRLQTECTGGHRTGESESR